MAIRKMYTGFGSAYANRQEKLRKLEEEKLANAVRIELVTQVEETTRRVLRGVAYELRSASGEVVRRGQVPADGVIVEWKVPPGDYRLAFPKIEETPSANYPDMEGGPVKDPDAKRVGTFSWIDFDKPIEGIATGVLNRVFIEREVIPIVFVPGIMGSRLKRVGRKAKKKWDPDDGVFMGKNYARRGAEGKQRMLLVDEEVSEEVIDPAGLQPYGDDASHNQEWAKGLALWLANYKPRRDYEGWLRLIEERDWGAVSWKFYGYLLVMLEVLGQWPELMRSLFDLPVHAFGYNWTESNWISGQKLRARIEEIRKKYKGGEGNKGKEEYKIYKNKELLCSKFVLVTHSMGGLVARAACVLDGVPGTPPLPVSLPPAEKDVLGVVHGVQPATGAGAAYWRMKAGWERNKLGDSLVAWALGRNQAEVTAIMGHIQGGLELLPNHLYRTNQGERGWLEIHKENGEIIRYPKSDPYKEIYLQEGMAYRLITKCHLLPGIGDSDSVEKAWEKCKKRINDAKAFHEAFGLKCHPETHAFYGAGKEHPTADRIVFKLHPWVPARYPIVTGMDGMPIEEVEEPPPAEGSEVCNGGAYWTYFREATQLMAMVLEQQDGAGDGTVPESSGSAVKPCGESQGTSPTCEARAFSGIDHGEAYAPGAGGDGEGKDTMGFVMGCIEKLCCMRLRKRS